MAAVPFAQIPLLELKDLCLWLSAVSPFWELSQLKKKVTSSKDIPLFE